MNRIMLAVAISLLAGLAIGGLVTGGVLVGKEPAAAGQPGPDQAAPDDRLARLEQIIEEEREARLALEDTLAMLFDELEQLEQAGAGTAARAATSRETVVDTEVLEERRRARGTAEWTQSYQDRRVDRLVEGGFTEDEARRILDQESRADYEAMQAAWEAQRNGEAIDPFNPALNPQALLRESLGDDAYARYLEAQGQPTAIQVSQVLGGSPANTAGLQPGDEIVSYNGERVFNVGDLRNLTLQGEPGEDVVIEVDRDGMRMQLTLPRGPIGITGNGASMRGLGRWWGGG